MQIESICLEFDKLEEQLISEIERFERGILKEVENNIKSSFIISKLRIISDENIGRFYNEFDKNLPIKKPKIENKDCDEDFIKKFFTDLMV